MLGPRVNRPLHHDLAPRTQYRDCVHYVFSGLVGLARFVCGRWRPGSRASRSAITR